MDDATRGVQRFGDVRRWVATRTLGSARILVLIQSAMEDIEGALEVGHVEVAALRARQVVNELASIVSLAGGGHLDSGHDELGFDPFDGIDVAEWQELIAVPAGMLDGGEAAERAHERLRRAVIEAEDSLRLDEALPEMRSPQGIFPTLRLAREAVGLANELGIMPAVPDDWGATDEP